MIETRRDRRSDRALGRSEARGSRGNRGAGQGPHLVGRPERARQKPRAVGIMGDGRDRGGAPFSGPDHSPRRVDRWQRWGKAMIDISRRTLTGLAVVYVASQVLPVTRLAYWPSEVWIDGSEVTVERHYPGDWLGLPRPQVSYVETVTPISGIGHNDRHNCQDARGAKRYTRPELTSWDISSWAAGSIDERSTTRDGK